MLLLIQIVLSFNFLRKTPIPEWFLKIHCQFVTYFVHKSSLLKWKLINEQRTDNPEGQVTYHIFLWRPGYLPALVYIFIYVAFLSLFYTFKIVTSTISQPALYDQNSVHRKKGHIHTMNFHNTSRFPYPEAFQTLQNYKTYSLPHHILPCSSVIISTMSKIIYSINWSCLLIYSSTLFKSFMLLCVWKEYCEDTFLYINPFINAEKSIISFSYWRNNNAILSSS